MNKFFLYNIFFFLSPKLHNPIGLYDARATPKLAAWAPLLFNLSTDFDEIWHRQSLDPEKGHRLPFIAKKR